MVHRTEAEGVPICALTGSQPDTCWAWCLSFRYTCIISGKEGADGHLGKAAGYEKRDLENGLLTVSLGQLQLLAFQLASPQQPLPNSGCCLHAFCHGIPAPFLSLGLLSVLSLSLCPNRAPSVISSCILPLESLPLLLLEGIRGWTKVK